MAAPVLENTNAVLTNGVTVGGRPFPTPSAAPDVPLDAPTERRNE
jgi:hypothetical protein